MHAVLILKSCENIDRDDHVEREGLFLAHDFIGLFYDTLVPLPSGQHSMAGRLQLNNGSCRIKSGRRIRGKDRVP